MTPELVDALLVAVDDLGRLSAASLEGPGANETVPSTDELPSTPIDAGAQAADPSPLSERSPPERCGAEAP